MAMFRNIKPEEVWIASDTTSDTLLFIKLPTSWVQQLVSLSQYFMPSQDVIQFLILQKRNKTAWEKVKSSAEVTEDSDKLMQLKNERSDLSRSLLECLVVLMYDRTSNTMEVNEARKYLFTQKSRALENIPPRKAALEQHIK